MIELSVILSCGHVAVVESPVPFDILDRMGFASASCPQGCGYRMIIKENKDTSSIDKPKKVG
jgi:hypothetical protein